MKMKTLSILVFLISLAAARPVYCDEKEAVIGTGTVTDAATALVDKTGALLSGNLDVEVAVKNDPHRYDYEYTTDAIGRRVPKKTAVKSGGALHSEEEL